MPIESVCLQALVSEPIKPVIDCVIMANTVHGYISQSDKGELVIGGGADPYNNYSQRGSFPALEHTITALVETFPFISRLKMLRTWGGIVDMTGDRSPIISKTDVKGLYVNCGWGTGRVQVDPRLRVRLCRYHRQRPPAPDRRAVQPQPLSRRPADRRKRRGRRRALGRMIRDNQLVSLPPPCGEGSRVGVAPAAPSPDPHP